MIGKIINQRNDQVTASVEDIVPKDHFLRAIEETIDFSFIEEKFSPYYCSDNGRPSIPPITLFKMLFIRYFYGIRSERQLEQEKKVNAAYRWFLGLSMNDKVPDPSTISFNRRTRFMDTSAFEVIFDVIVQQAIEHQMVSGRILMTDSTHIKANANKNKFMRKVKVERPKAYIEELEEAVQEDRLEHGKKH